MSSASAASAASADEPGPISSALDEAAEVVAGELLFSSLLALFPLLPHSPVLSFISLSEGPTYTSKIELACGWMLD